MSENKPQEATMIATLGGQPQVVTFALDYLIERGKRRNEVISEVIVLCLSPRDDRLKRSQDRLREELNTAYTDQNSDVQFQEIRVHGRPVVDVRNSQAVNDVSQFVNNLIYQQKSMGRILHVCVSGGRRFLSLLTVNVATLHFQQLDKLWHMYTSDVYQAMAKGGKMMHFPEDYTPNDFQLIEVPVLPLGQYFPGFQATTSVMDKRIEIDIVEERRCQSVVKELTERQLATLKAFSMGLTRKQVAEELTISMATVDQYKTVVYDVCRAVWNYPESQRLNTSFLVTKFSNYQFPRPQ